MTAAAGGGGGLREAVRAWIADDPDPSTRSELERLLADGGAAAAAELADRFADHLRFGTAGLRGAVAAGPNRMNRATVRAATAALAAWLAGHRPGSAEAGVVVGCDARHGSAEFAEETAAVLAGAGVRVHLLEPRRPTPLLAFAVRHLGAAAGVMITASHNPPADNGYKLYLGDGAQIVPPVDGEVEELIRHGRRLRDVPTGDPAGPLVVRHGGEVVDAYLAELAAESPAPAGAGELRIVYTPLHGVARRTFEAALAAAGFPAALVVAEQAEPDPDFPTVAFPNPEEPGSLDLALRLAARHGADVVVANDPDGDRLAAAVPDPATGGWRVLTGDQLGSLLGAHVLQRTAGTADPAARLVATTIVSSGLLGRVAAAAGARYAETLTGFKWIVRAAEERPGSRFVFGYEEALGYAVGTVVRDKDGIGAALALLDLVARRRAAGSGLLEMLDELELRHGVHRTTQRSLRTGTPAATMARLRAAPPAEIGGRPVRGSRDLLRPSAGDPPLPPADVLVYRLDGARVVVRPSGTEPKLKAYLEVVRAVRGGDLAAARAAAAGETEALLAALEPLLAAPG